MKKKINEKILSLLRSSVPEDVKLGIILFGNSITPEEIPDYFESEMSVESERSVEAVLGNHKTIRYSISIKNIRFVKGVTYTTFLFDGFSLWLGEHNLYCNKSINNGKNTRTLGARRR